ncbi:MAG: hypothetical protein EOO15_18270, partial [Chitinophagaceae bacterium]
MSTSANAQRDSAQWLATLTAERSRHHLLRDILEHHGYPGIRELGAPGAERLWMLLQKADS